MNHDELVKRAVRWLRNTKRCGVVCPELVTYAPENPDVIGWANLGGQSFMVEVKTSRSDFQRDKHKPVRRNPERGVGHFRFYFTEPGLIYIDELPPSWGLAECHLRRVSVVKSAEWQQQNEASEVMMMYSLLRRAERRGLLTQCLAMKWGGSGI